MKALGHIRQPGRVRAADDFYVEPAWAVDALLNAIGIVLGWVWDPACGTGTIPRACNRRGIRAVGSDIASRGYGRTGVDFLTTTKLRAETIICNPPFSLAEEFVRHARKLGARRVVIMQRLAFLEGRARHDRLFRDDPPTNVWVHCGRVSMPPGDVDVKPKGGAVAFAWFDWDARARVSAPTIGWIP